MRLLISVSNAAEASAALAGGADVIDAKDPSAGALGAVSPDVLRQICTVVAGTRVVTAAIGDAADDAAIERTAATFAVAGAALVKVGFAGISAADRIEELLTAAIRGARSGLLSGPSLDDDAMRPKADHTGVIAVAYADAERVGSIAPTVLIHIAARVGAAGVLLDTADKTAPGLRELVAPAALARWVAAAHEARLSAALAGKLSAADLALVREAGADIAGVRGAACEGGRSGRISAEKVAVLRTLCNPEGGSHVRELASVS
jgi:uncharacterized protein (UPF0264 family)